MTAAVDSLFVALFIAMVPEPDMGMAAMPQLAGLQTEPQQAAKPMTDLRDPEACRYFVDPDARRKCVIRTNRAVSGAAEPSPSFPEGTIWLTPDEPRMPSKMPANSPR